MKNDKVDFEALREACVRMTKVIDVILYPHTSPAVKYSFNSVANDIRYELDGSESCVPEVRERVLRKQQGG